MRTSFTQLGLGIIVAIALVYLLLVVLFQSSLDPLIIMVAVPGAFVGVLWMLAVTGTTLNVESFMGAIMAIGIAVSNSILLVSFANERARSRTRSSTPIEAALAAGRTRLRPVLMTALAMILGMLPMALALGEGGEQNAPLGRAVIGGLLVATLVTLLRGAARVRGLPEEAADARPEGPRGRQGRCALRGPRGPRAHGEGGAGMTQDERRKADEPERPKEIRVQGPVTIVVEPGRGEPRADDAPPPAAPECPPDEVSAPRADATKHEENDDAAPPPHAARRSRLVSTLAVALVVVAAVVAVALWIDRRHAAARERDSRDKVVAKGPKVRVVTVKMSDAKRELTLPGELRGYEQTTLYSKLAGFMRSMRVDRGDRVKKGDILAVIESPENDDDVTQAVSDAEVKRINANRLRALEASGVASALDRDNAINASRMADAFLGRTRTIKGYEVIRAPFAGAITARYVDAGALLPAATGATQSAQPVVDLARVDKLRVFVYLGQDTASFVRVGDIATIWQDERPEERIDARVSRTTSSLDPRTRTMQTEIDIDNGDGHLLPGTFVRVKLAVAVPPAAEVPSEALVFRSGKDTVAEVHDGHVHFREVEIASTDGRTTRIARGLAGGETLALDVPLEVREGSAVEVASESLTGR